MLKCEFLHTLSGCQMQFFHATMFSLRSTSPEQAEKSLLPLPVPKMVIAFKLFHLLPSSSSLPLSCKYHITKHRGLPLLSQSILLLKGKMKHCNRLKTQSLTSSEVLLVNSHFFSCHWPLLELQLLVNKVC